MKLVMDDIFIDGGVLIDLVLKILCSSESLVILPVVFFTFGIRCYHLDLLDITAQYKVSLLYLQGVCKCLFLLKLYVCVNCFS